LCFFPQPERRRHTGHPIPSIGGIDWAKPNWLLLPPPAPLAPVRPAPVSAKHNVDARRFLFLARFQAAIASVGLASRLHHDRCMTLCRLPKSIARSKGKKKQRKVKSPQQAAHAENSTGRVSAALCREFWDSGVSEHSCQATLAGASSTLCFPSLDASKAAREQGCADRSAAPTLPLSLPASRHLFCARTIE
jgi:hypothetical protein